MSIELAWARCRRRLLRWFRPGYVRRMADKRQGDCPGCPHDIIDARDLKYCRNVCGFWFHRQDSPFRTRGPFGLARYGLAELLIFSLLLGVAAVCLAIAGAMLHWSAWLGLFPVVLAWLEIVYFFRDPQRSIPDDPHALVSPADGTVTNVEEVVQDDFPGGRALRISIFLSIFNVHVNRIPRSGRVVDVRYFPGAFLDARNPESAVRNEQLWIDMVEADTGRPMRVKQISGAIARRIVCWLKAGDEVARGERLGMIKLGSRTDLLLPADAAMEVLVKPGDKVRGAATVLLRLP